MKNSLDYNQLNALPLPLPFKACIMMAVSGAHSVLPHTYIHVPLLFLC